MDTAQWPQEIVVKPIEEIVVTPKPQAPSTGSGSGSGSGSGVVLVDQRKLAKEEAINCPRCHSTNTKFCYYNNYSLTQPRYFCKGCRRYWTQGGSLRNIPVGGGSRKNKRPPPLVSCSSSPPPHKNIKLNHDENINNPNKDLNLAFKNISEFVIQQNNSVSASSSTSTTTTTTASTSQHHQHHHLSAMELLTSSPSSGSRGLMMNSSHFMHVPVVSVQPDPNTVYSTCGFPLQDFKSSLNFSLDGIGSTRFASLHHQDQTSVGGGGRLLFPFEDLKQVSADTTTTMDHGGDKEQQVDHNSNGYWTGMLGGGGGGGSW